jgi:hypothetical protein
MAVVTVEQVNDHLSNPPWSAAQERACAELIDKRQAELQNWLTVPIEPGAPVTETVPVLCSGVLSTRHPVYQVLTLAETAVTGGLAGCALPDPYFWYDEHWLAVPRALEYQLGYTSRPFSLEYGIGPQPGVAITYLPGWGPTPDITGAIIAKVAAVMLNRHDDTVTARALDEKAPPALKEEWTDDDLKMLKRRRRPVGAR